jgi:WD40 repeat protein
MKKAVYAVGLTLAALALSGVSFAQSGQIAPPATAIFSVANNDLSSGNSATVVKCTPGSTYHCSVFNTLVTGGTGLGGGYFAAPRVGQENTSECLYIADAGSSDIAAFWKNGSVFSLTGNYSNSALSGDYEGMGLAASPDGKFLYAAYSGSDNLGVWAVGTDCALTFKSSTQESDAVAPIALTSDGKVLVVSEPNNGTLDTFLTNESKGTLTLVNSVSCGSGSCFPTGIDITKVSSSGTYFVVAGDATLDGPYFASADLTSAGVLSNVAVDSTTLASSGLQNCESPLFTVGGLSGSGILYFGAAGFGTGYPAGVAVTTISSGNKITYNSAYVNNAAYYASNASTVSAGQTGGGIWQSGVNSNADNTVYVYTLSGTTLTNVGSVANTAAAGSYALSIGGLGGR